MNSRILDTKLLTTVLIFSLVVSFKIIAIEKLKDERKQFYTQLFGEYSKGEIFQKNCHSKADMINQKISSGYITQFDSAQMNELIWRVGIFRKGIDEQSQSGLFYEKNGVMTNLIVGFSGFLIPQKGYFLFVSNNRPLQHSADSEVFKILTNEDGTFEVKSLIKKDRFICESIVLDDQSVVLISGNYNSGLALRITKDLEIYEVEYYQYDKSP